MTALIDNLGTYAISLDSQSHDFLKSLGIDTPTFDVNKQKSVFVSGLAALEAALTRGEPVDDEDAKLIRFVLDVVNDDADGVSSIKDFANWLYSDGSSSSGGVDDKVQTYLNMGLPITPELAPVICDLTFVIDMTDAGMDVKTLMLNIVQGLNNGTQPPNFSSSNTLTWAYPPPAEAIATLGGWTGTIGSNSWNFPTTWTGKTIALYFANRYIEYAKDNSIPLQQDFVDVFAALAQPATLESCIAGTLSTTGSLALDGSVDAALMEAFRKLRPNDASDSNSITSDNVPGPTSANSGTWPTLERPFESDPPVIAGWAYFALTSMVRSIDANKPIDPTMLQNLDFIDPWAGLYVRWHALTEQATTGALDSKLLLALAAGDPAAAADVCLAALEVQLDNDEELSPEYLKILSERDLERTSSLCVEALENQLASRQTLNIDYLRYVASFDPDLAASLCVRALEDALQPTNKLITDSSIGGSDDPTAHDNLTNVATPTIRVDLRGMGATLPNADDELILYANDNEVGRMTLTAGDIGLGYVDIAPAAPLVDDTYAITTKFTSPADDETSTGMVSASSTPLVITIDSTPPVPPQVWFRSANEIILSMSDALSGLAGVTPQGSSFQIIAPPPRGPVGIASVTVDAVNNWVKLTLSAPLLPVPTTVSITYSVVDGEPLQDMAGNALATFTKTATSDPSIFGYPANVVASTRAAAPPPPPPRALDMNAWTVLQTLNPALAQQWWSRFASSGLLPPPPSEPPNNIDVSALDLETALWMVFTGRAQAIEDQLKQQIAITQQKNDAMSKLNEMLGAMNKLGATVGSDATATSNLKDKLGDKWTTLSTEVNTAITNSGTSPFNTSDGRLDDTITKGDLEGAIQKLKGQIDSLGNNQQTEMLRLQSLTTKRNECFDLLTNHMSKMANVRDKVIDNIR